jgi:mannose-6-phosphate isomerase
VYSEPNGKTEAWHILWAAPGASILAGIKSGLSRTDLFDAFKRQDYPAVMPRFPIHAGDTVYVPAGVLHTFGPDTFVFEIQQTSDLTRTVMPSDLYGNAYSVEEWSRNINATLDELRTHYQPRPNPGLARTVGANRYVVSCAGPYFALERWTLTAPHLEVAHPHRCLTLSNVGPRARLEWEGMTDTLERGESCILPAAMGNVQIVPDGEASLVACYVPDMESDIIDPLRAAGYADEQIRTLGEVEV